MNTEPKPTTPESSSERTFQFDKLVRNGVLDSMLERGDKVEYKTLEGQELLQALKAKVVEEAAEMPTDNPTEGLKELADLQETLDAMRVALGKTEADVRAAQEAKNTKAGSFSKGIYISTVTIKPDNPWLSYMLENPKRYPEVTDED